MRDKGVFACLLGLLVVDNVANNNMCTRIGKRSVRNEAIAHGAAYWTVNPTNGATTFTWRANEH